MTRIQDQRHTRPRRPRDLLAAPVMTIPSLLLPLLLLCFCTSACASLESPPRLVAPAPAPFPANRRLGQDKDATDEPTAAPSSTPSTVAPTFSSSSVPTTAPSKVPTAQPTFSPSVIPSGSPTLSPTAAPTLSPSIVPTFEEIPGTAGNLVLSFSVVDTATAASNSTLSTTSAFDILMGRAPELTQAVLGSLLAMICKEMDVRVVAEALTTAPNYCQGSSRRRSRRSSRRLYGSSLQRHEQESRDSIVVSTARLGVRDNTDPALSSSLTWTEWTVVYPVLQVGDIFLQTAQQNGANGDGNVIMTEEELVEEGLLIFQSVARLALTAEIQDGTLDQDWPEDFKSSQVGREVETFGVEDTQDDDDNESAGYTDPLDPAPLHTLRITGIAMLVAIVVLWFAMLKIAKSRRMEREWDKEYIKRGHGGLGTEEGLDFMLDEGRRQSLKLTQELSDDEQGVEMHPPRTMNQQPRGDKDSTVEEGTNRSATVSQAASQSEQAAGSSMLNLGGADTSIAHPDNEEVDRHTSLVLI